MRNVPLDMAQINLMQDGTMFTGSEMNLVHVTGGTTANPINFLAFALQNPTASLDGNPANRPIYTGATTATFNYTTSNFSNAPTVNVSNISGTGNAAPINGGISVTNLDNTSVNTFSFTVTILDGTEQILQQNRSVSFTDQRRVSLSNDGPIDLAWTDDLEVRVNTLNSGAQVASGGIDWDIPGTSNTGDDSPFIVGRTLIANGSTTLTSTITDARTPARTYDPSTTINAYRSYYFWATTENPILDPITNPNPDQPPQSSAEFDGRVQLEFGTDQTLSSGNTQMNYYLAYPQDLMAFMYRANNFPSAATLVATLPLNGVMYSVYFFDGVDAMVDITVMR